MFREIEGELKDYIGRCIIAITTNGTVKKDGSANMGRGNAREFAALFPDIPKILGRKISESGNRVHILSDNIVSFPVEHCFYDNPDPKLIEASAKQLRELADEKGWSEIVVPRPGCGGGGLRWEDVRPILVGFFDERFLIISKV
ncbi:hypothetical protein [Limisalsivibrio acetivorans]|uniref:hypothetical protein n=1 Tax=Limisalsivibrio acetivorans TaxID=1304888 RepID=UPI0003B7815A|nr:hypothetical protein [Limisalsivibrio acetivorans]